MGAKPCNCVCDNDEKEGALSSTQPVNSWAEVPESRGDGPVATVPEVVSLEPAVQQPAAAQPVETPVQQLSQPEPAKAAVDDSPETAATSSQVRRIKFQIKAAQTLGIRFLAEGAVVVSGIEDDSPLKKTVDGKPGLNHGDVIVEVDGERGTKEALLGRLQAKRGSGGPLDLCVCQRPKTFWIVLDPRSAAKEAKMGLVVVVQEEEPSRLEVRHVRDQGVLTTWNEENFYTPVCGGDWVTKIGTQKGECAPGTENAEKMITAMQKIWSEGNTLHLEVECCEPGVTPAAAG